MSDFDIPRTQAEAEDDARLLRAQSIELRKGLEDLMEHIQNSRHEESSESLEERYILLVSTYPSECLKIAVTLTDADVMEHESSIYSSSPPQSATGASLRLPIHLAYDKNAPLSIIKSLLDADARKNGDHPSVTKADKWGDLPIHIACSRASAKLSDSDQQLYGMGLEPTQGQYPTLRQILTQRRMRQIHYDETVESIRLLLDADKDKSTLSVKDVYESLPLHTAARYNAPPKVISLLLEKSRDGLYIEGIHGQFPLTVACRSGDLRPEVLKILLEHDDANARENPMRSGKDQPSTVMHKETTGRLPIHVFMLRNKCEVCLRILLEHMFGTSHLGLPSRNSILSTGLDNWKRLWLTKVIPAMDGKNLYERDFTTRDKLDVICSQARVVCEVCLSLELVAWKMSILSGIRGEPSNTDNFATKLLKDNKWKSHRRIVSSAEVIVPNVMSFLQNEPVERIVEQFRSYGYLGK